MGRDAADLARVIGAVCFLDVERLQGRDGVVVFGFGLVIFWKDLRWLVLWLILWNSGDFRSCNYSNMQSNWLNYYKKLYLIMSFSPTYEIQNVWCKKVSGTLDIFRKITKSQTHFPFWFVSDKYFFHRSLTRVDNISTKSGHLHENSNSSRDCFSPEFKSSTRNRSSYLSYSKFTGDSSDS